MVNPFKKYSKPLGNTLYFKQDFFNKNDKKLKEFKDISNIYRVQPKRKNCKICNQNISFDKNEYFTKWGIKYSFCKNCNHLNGEFEDTNEFCNHVYTDNDGEEYSKTYVSSKSDFYKRVDSIYKPKAEFLRESLNKISRLTTDIADLGAGSGHFLAAARDIGFKKCMGYEPSKTMVDFGNSVLGDNLLNKIDIKNIVNIAKNIEAETVSMIFVLEHVQNPREILYQISKNNSIKNLFISVPLYSLSIFIESVFDKVMPRHLAAGHTHLFTKGSIANICKEYGFEIASEWWFGSDITDLFRSFLINMNLEQENNYLKDLVKKDFFPILDCMQSSLDKSEFCGEIHMLLTKTNN